MFNNFLINILRFLEANLLHFLQYNSEDCRVVTRGARSRGLSKPL
jgi:hypothetical protein